MKLDDHPERIYFYKSTKRKKKYINRVEYYIKFLKQKKLSETIVYYLKGYFSQLVV